MPGTHARHMSDCTKTATAFVMDPNLADPRAGSLNIQQLHGRLQPIKKLKACSWPCCKDQLHASLKPPTGFPCEAMTGGGGVHSKPSARELAKTWLRAIDVAELATPPAVQAGRGCVFVHAGSVTPCQGQSSALPRAYSRSHNLQAVHVQMRSPRWLQLAQQQKATAPSLLSEGALGAEGGRVPQSLRLHMPCSCGSNPSDAQEAGGGGLRGGVGGRVKGEGRRLSGWMMFAGSN